MRSCICSIDLYSKEKDKTKTKVLDKTTLQRETKIKH